MIKIINQDRYDGEILDTTLEVNFAITIVGSELTEFKQQLKELIDKYRI